ncbi:MAG: hypothetical protein Q8K18_11285 [Burkholderiales bacterium]|nr:hypothetical protein [Burkholderiales bacterium]
MPVPRQAQVLTMGAQVPAAEAAFPAEGEVWRLSDSEFQALGPLPVVNEIGPGEADPVPSPYTRRPAESRDYRSYSYFIPLPALFYHGPRFSFSYGYPGYWPRNPLAPFPRNYSRAWRYRPR